MSLIWRTLLISTLVPAALTGPAGCIVNESSDQQNTVGALLGRLLGERESERRERLIENLGSDDADLRREGVLMLGRGEAADLKVTSELLATMTQSDPEPQVRAAAVQVLNKIAPREKLQEILPKAIRDDSVAVRMECVRALSQQQDEPSQSLLLEMLGGDPDGAVRAEAAQALAVFRYPSTVRGLIRALAEDDEFGVWYRSRQSLQKLTGKEFGYNHQAWRQWFDTVENPLIDKVLEDKCRP